MPGGRSPPSIRTCWIWRLPRGRQVERTPASFGIFCVPFLVDEPAEWCNWRTRSAIIDHVTVSMYKLTDLIRSHLADVSSDSEGVARWWHAGLGLLVTDQRHHTALLLLAQVPQSTELSRVAEVGGSSSAHHLPWFVIDTVLLPHVYPPPVGRRTGMQRGPSPCHRGAVGTPTFPGPRHGPIALGTIPRSLPDMGSHSTVGCVLWLQPSGTRRTRKISLRRPPPSQHAWRGRWRLSLWLSPPGQHGLLSGGEGVELGLLGVVLVYVGPHLILLLDDAGSCVAQDGSAYSGHSS